MSETKKNSHLEHMISENSNLQLPFNHERSNPLNYATKPNQRYSAISTIAQQMQANSRVPTITRRSSKAIGKNAMERNNKQTNL